MGESVLTGPVVADTEALFLDAGLERRGASLYFGGVALSGLAEAVGTPAYVYNAEAIRLRYRTLDAAFAAVPHRVCFAVKANSNLAVMRILRDLGAGADIVSVGEMHRALAAGFAPEAIVFSGVGKTRDELRAAVRAQVGHINVESREELELLGRIADEEALDVSVGIRVNPDVTADTHPYITTGKGGIKFGIPHDQVLDAATFVLGHARLSLTSLAMHLGSQLTEARPYREGAERLLGLVDDVQGIGITTLEALDVGGGLGIRYADESPLEPETLAAAIVPLLAPTGLTVYVEPGRYLVGSAGILLTEVLYRKQSGGKEFVVVDAGMTDLVRPSRYQAYHEIVEVEAVARPASAVDVVGPICETGDFLALDRQLPAVERGERLAILGAGAYGFVMSSNYNTRPLPPEVIVDGGRFWVSRPRESVSALFARERVTDEG